MDFWNGSVPLVGGYSTTRRDALKFAALGGLVASTYVLLTRAKVCAHLLPVKALALLLAFLKHRFKKVFKKPKNKTLQKLRLPSRFVSWWAVMREPGGGGGSAHAGVLGGRG